VNEVSDYTFHIEYIVQPNPSPSFRMLRHLLINPLTISAEYAIVEEVFAHSKAIENSWRYHFPLFLSCDSILSRPLQPVTP